MAPHFLSMPQEIRFKIFKHAMDRPTSGKLLIECRSTTPQRYLNDNKYLLLICKQLTTEVQYLLSKPMIRVCGLYCLRQRLLEYRTQFVDTLAPFRITVPTVMVSHTGLSFSNAVFCQWLQLQLGMDDSEFRAVRIEGNVRRDAWVDLIFSFRGAHQPASASRKASLRSSRR